MAFRWSLRLVSACVADEVWRGHTLVRQMHRHTRRRVVEVVAVIHPDAGIVGAKADLEYLAGLDLQRIRPPRAADDWLTIPTQHQGVVTMQVHRVIVVAAVDEGHLDQIASADHQHRRVQEDLAVNSRPREQLPVIEARAIVEYQSEFSVEVARSVEGYGRRRPVNCRVE